MNELFLPVLFLGTAAIALWVDVRFPRLAPASLALRGAGGVCALLLMRFVHASTGTEAALYGSVFGLVLPTLVFVWLQALWMFRALLELTSAAR